MENLDSEKGRDLPKVKAAANMYNVFVGITRSYLTCRRRNYKKAPPLGRGIIKRLISLGADAVQSQGFLVGTQNAAGFWISTRRRIREPLEVGGGS